MDIQEHRVVIVGASAAGLKCASRLRRLDPRVKITVMEQKSEFSWAACGLPYVVSGDIEDLQRLRKTPDGALRDADFFQRIKGVDVLAGFRAHTLDVNAQTLTISSESEEKNLFWDDLVLALGALPSHLPGQLPHPRVQFFHGPSDVTPVIAGLEKREIENVVIVGAGFTGVELAEAFTATWGAGVTLVEAAAFPLSMQVDDEVGALVAKVLRDQGVNLITSAPVERILPTEKDVTLIAGGQTITGDIAIIAVGTRPNTELARKAGIKLGTTGAIAVDEHLATSIPHIWAIGDCIEVTHAVSKLQCRAPLGSLANRQGRKLAEILSTGKGIFGPVAQATCVKIFDWTAAAIGLTRKQAQAINLTARSVWLAPHDRADYWPEAQEIYLHLVYEKGTGRLLGLQCAGPGEAAKRIDAISSFIADKATIFDLVDFEHAYSPPIAPVLEPLAVAAMVAQNQESGLESLPPALPSFPFPGSELHATLLDVRHVEERKERPCPFEGSISMPLEDLRARINELCDGPFIAVCQRGARSAEAARILQHHGRKAVYLGGGIRWYAACKS